MKRKSNIVLTLCLWGAISLATASAVVLTSDEDNAELNLIDDLILDTDIDTIIENNKKYQQYLNDSLFDVAVEIIKKYEGWHTAQHYPYVGYGHKLLPGDDFDHNISEEFADRLLREDLRQKCSEFREYGQDSILLGTLAYNIGEYTIKGGFGRKESELIQKLKRGDRDIYAEYTSFRMWKGRVVKSIERRRIEEFENLYAYVK